MTPGDKNVIQVNVIPPFYEHVGNKTQFIHLLWVGGYVIIKNSPYLFPNSYNILKFPFLFLIA